MRFQLKRSEFLFLILIYFAGVGFRLIPRLYLDPHQLTFHADIWYRLCLAQYLIDNGHLPLWDIRYLAYGQVPLWYNPWSLYFFAFLHHLTQLDLPTICSRLMPFIESLSILPLYFLCRALYSKRVAFLATTFLLLSPTYLFWTGISTLQSFTLFLLPITILLWIKFLQKQFIFKNKWVHLGFMGVLLAFNFLIHLSFFTHVIILLCIQLSLIIEKKSRIKDYLYLAVPLFLSQLLTISWWLPRDLYWWWSTGLTTSSGFAEGLKFLKEYGVTSGLLGHTALIGLIIFCLIKKKSIPSFYLLPIFWMLFPLIESHNEGWLTIIRRIDLTWNNFFKPLEGFRFYVFLSQPLAVCFALMAEKALRVSFLKTELKKRVVRILLLILVGIVMILDIFLLYKLPVRFGVSGMEPRDIKAAQWFKTHTPASSRIVADYYNAQMFSGICAGKALLGSVFPLKGILIPYITEKGRVQREVCLIYQCYNAAAIKALLRQYQCTHIFVSDRNLLYIENMADPKKPIIKAKLLKTLSDKNYFKLIYQDEDIKIFELLSD